MISLPSIRTVSTQQRISLTSQIVIVIYQPEKLAERQKRSLLLKWIEKTNVNVGVLSNSALSSYLGCWCAFHTRTPSVCCQSHCLGNYYHSNHWQNWCQKWGYHTAIVGLERIFAAGFPWRAVDQSRQRHWDKRQSGPWHQPASSRTGWELPRLSSDLIATIIQSNFKIHLKCFRFTDMTLMLCM